ncbi:MAG: hypothetical protein R3F34_07670 [Planctomycetota bacterium]
MVARHVDPGDAGRLAARARAEQATRRAPGDRERGDRGGRPDEFRERLLSEEDGADRDGDRGRRRSSPRAIAGASAQKESAAKPVGGKRSRPDRDGVRARTGLEVLGQEFVLAAVQVLLARLDAAG